MRNVPTRLINLISSVPYNVTTQYGLPDNVVINYIKKFRKEMTSEEFTSFIEPVKQKKYGNNSDNIPVHDKTSLLTLVFGSTDNFDLYFSEDQVKRIKSGFFNFDEFKTLLNSVSSNFNGDDFKLCKTLDEVFECRSYRISLILNGELCSE